MRWKLLLWISACLVLMGVPSLMSAQEFRATVTGRVVDESDAAMPGVTVNVVNTETNEVATAVTTGDGAYAVPFLRPGVYMLTAELDGFRRYQQDEIQLSVGQTATVNITLEVGELEETVEVTAEVFDATRADRGQVIDNKRVTEMPLNARNPFDLSRLSPGITYNGPAIYVRPFDNGAIADWSISGGQNRNNEFLLDGAPNNSLAGGNNIAYVPPVDAVEEFTITTNSYDAQYGRTAGGVVNVSLKSGTNDLSGTVYEFARRKWLDSPDYLVQVTGEEKPDHKLDQYGFQLGGPIVIPGLYEGRDRTFFMVNYEGYREASQDVSTAATWTVPDEAQRRGDFSNLRDASGNVITIYDPATGRVENGQFVRDPFPGNVIPADRIHPMAATLMEQFPEANTTTGGDPWRDNYLFGTNIADDTFHNLATKVDHNVSDRTRMFVRYAQNFREEMRHTNPILEGPAQRGQLPHQRINYTGVVDWVHTASNSLVLNVRTSVNRFTENNRTEASWDFNAAELGFPAELAAQMPVSLFPSINFADDYMGFGGGGFNDSTTTVYSLQPNVSWLTGGHNVRAGLDMRMSWFSQRQAGAGGMTFSFDPGFTQEQWDLGDPLSGNSFASFLLGAPASGAIDNNLFPDLRWNYFAPWIQDDWQITDRLTLNLGLRWDFNSPVWERENRRNRGFDPEAINPVSDRIEGEVRGGLGFTGVDGNPRYPYDWDWNNVQPRAGFAYSIDEMTVLRGGYGRYFMNPTGQSTANGFSIQTPLVTSLDGGRTPSVNFGNPYPGGVAQPPGAELGLETLLGQSPNFSNTSFEVPYVHQFSLGVQRQLPWRASVELTYVGSRTRSAQSSWGGFNDPSPEFRAQCDPTVGGSPDFCNEELANPFFEVPGFEGTTHFTSPTLSRFDLARPFPQFGRIVEFERNDGRIWYNSLQAVFNKQFSDGLTINATYTWSKMLEENHSGQNDSSFIDDVSMARQRAPYFSDRRHRVTLSGVYDLPFGQDRALLGDATGPLNALVSGWQLSGLWVFNSGAPWDLPGNVFYVADAEVPDVDRSADIMRGVMPCVARMANDGETVAMLDFSAAAGCTEPNVIIRPSFAPRDVPFRDAHIRRPSFFQFDLNLAKTTALTSGTQLQLRLEVFNVFNHAMYDERHWENDPENAEFGTINRANVRQSNFPRQIQLGIKLLF